MPFLFSGTKKKPSNIFCNMPPCIAPCTGGGGLRTVENYSDSLHISGIIIGLCK